VVAPYYWGNLEKGTRDGLYMLMLWGGGGLRAPPEGVPGVGEPEEKKLCAGHTAALGHDVGPGGCGTVLPGGLQLGYPATAAALTTTTTTTTTQAPEFSLSVRKLGRGLGPHSVTQNVSKMELILYSTGKPRFNESEGTKDFVLYSKSFVIGRVFYYRFHYRGT
jgi:hypothetical protein